LISLSNFVFFIVTALAAQSACAQFKAMPEKFCGSGDKSYECNLQRNKADNARAQRELDEYYRKNQEALDKRQAAEQEKQRLRSINEKDCNPRTQRCN